jgi:tetratricopeptide (TPR) repeat protein
MGDPDASFSLARVLQTLLSAAYPRVRFEVVNAAITAINSNVDRGIASDCGRLEPDLLVLYEGNNEVIGPFGPAGVFSPFFRSEPAIRAALWAEGTRSGQLLADAARRLRNGKEVPSEWGGMQMFLSEAVEAGDPRLDLVRDHLRDNVLAIAETARRAKAPLLLCTDPVNIRDFPPFLSRHRPGLSAPDLEAWNRHFDRGKTLEESGDPGRAEPEYRAALAIDDRYAEAEFRLGRVLLAEGRAAEARDHLRRALDLDALRFRTDSGLNRAIREAAGQAPGATLVDLAADLDAQSPGGVAGNNFFYEHVHLNLAGTYAAARDLFPGVVADLIRRGLVAGPAPEPIGAGEVRLRLGFTLYEQGMIGLQLLNRFRQAPFSGQSDATERIDAWRRRIAATDRILGSPGATDALRAIGEQALRLTPGDWMLARNTGEMLVARGRPAEALPLLVLAKSWIDDDVDTLAALGWAERGVGDTAAAERDFAAARALEPRYPTLPAL